jgi:hypothetical protein
MVPSRKTAPGSVIPSRLHPPSPDSQSVQDDTWNTLTTVRKKEISLRGTRRSVRASDVIPAPDDTGVAGTKIIKGERGVYGRYDRQVSRSVNTAIQWDRILCRTSALCRFDVRKRHPDYSHRVPIDSALIAKNIDTPRTSTLRKRARDRSSCKGRQYDEESRKSHAAWREDNLTTVCTSLIYAQHRPKCWIGTANFDAFGCVRLKICGRQESF